MNREEKYTVAYIPDYITDIPKYHNYTQCPCGSRDNIPSPGGQFKANGQPIVPK